MAKGDKEMTCYLCNTEIFAWEERTIIWVHGERTLEAHVECQADANMEAHE